MTNAREKQRRESAARLDAIKETFERQMRARGFDPSQAENVALTSDLARLYAAREAARAELDELSQSIDEEASDTQ